MWYPGRKFWLCIALFWCIWELPWDGDRRTLEDDDRVDRVAVPFVPVVDIPKSTPDGDHLVPIYLRFINGLEAVHHRQLWELWCRPIDPSVVAKQFQGFQGFQGPTARRPGACCFPWWSLQGFPWFGWMAYRCWWLVAAWAVRSDCARRPTGESEICHMLCRLRSLHGRIEKNRDDEQKFINCIA